MRWGIDLACLATAKTGAGIYVRELVKALRRMDAAGMVEFTPRGYPVEKWGGLGKIWNNLRLLYWIQIELPRKVEQEGCRVLISPEYLMPLKNNAAKIVIAYDAAFAKRPKEYNFYWRLLFRWFYLPAICKAATVVTITELAKKEIELFYGVAANRIKVIPCACDLKQFHPQSDQQVEDVLRRYGLNRGKYFIHVGVMEKRKNLPQLVKAFSRISARYPEYKLILVGQKGPKWNLDDSQTILRMINHWGIQDKVLLPGYLPREHLPLLYQGANAMVFPTVYEGFGIPLLEAMACQTAIACSDLPVLREVAQAAAIYFNPESEIQIADAMQKLIEQPALVAGLIAHGQKRVQSFSWEKTGRDFMQLIEQIEG